MSVTGVSLYLGRNFFHGGRLAVIIIPYVYYNPSCTGLENIVIVAVAMHQIGERSPLDDRPKTPDPVGSMPCKNFKKVLFLLEDGLAALGDGACSMGPTMFSSPSGGNLPSL